jgi:hypothetical protein
MIVQAAKNKNWLLFSRTRRDFRESPDKAFFVDGGQLDYFRAGYDEKGIERVHIKVSQTYADLLNDCNLKENKYGIINLNDYTPIYATEEEFRFQEFPLLWGVNTYKGSIYKELRELTTEHLENILKTEGNHISEKYKSEIKKILDERIEKQNAMVELAKNEIRGSQIARELGVSYFYVREVLSKAGSLVWLDHQELIELRNSRKNNNTNQ